MRCLWPPLSFTPLLLTGVPSPKGRRARSMSSEQALMTVAYHSSSTRSSEEPIMLSRIEPLTIQDPRAQ